MAIFRCKMCGGNLEIQTGDSVCTCGYCGTEQTLPRLDTEKKENLYNRANHFRRNNDYDKAMGIYEQILNEDNTDAEAYWSLVLCRYGIEYVEDPVSHKRIPTINRTQYTSIYADEDYKAAIKNADTAQKIVYEQEAKAIDEIQKGILEISNKEAPFDVFICYKETDDAGRRTPDSVLANDLYHQLTQEGFKVFFSRITLEDKLGQEYEPYIFAALNSAKVMVVLGTKPNYFQAVWVRNEWSRYLSLIRKGEKKMLVPAYKDMDPYDLPDEFSHLQAQDMSKLGFMQDLIRGIVKILGSDNKKGSAYVETPVIQQNAVPSNNNVSALLQRGNMALEDREWKKAYDFFEDVLNQNAECGEAYLGELFATYEVESLEKLLDKLIKKYQTANRVIVHAMEIDDKYIEKVCKEKSLGLYLKEDTIRNIYDIDNEFTYYSEYESRLQQKERQLDEIRNEKLLTRAKQYVTDERKSQIDNFISCIEKTLNSRVEKAEIEDQKSRNKILHDYCEYKKKADCRVNELYRNAFAQIENDYNNCVRILNNSTYSIDKFKELENNFLKMGDYKASKKLAQACQNEIENIRKEEELQRIENEMKFEKKSQYARYIMIAIFFFFSLFIAWLQQ